MLSMKNNPTREQWYNNDNRGDELYQERANGRYFLFEMGTRDNEFDDNDDNV